MSTNKPTPPEDLRVRRTRKLLSDALIALLDEQSFESISVREICERAMVHRATFYTHFTDKYDLLRHVLQSTRDDLAIIQQTEAQREEEKHFHLPVIEYVISHQALFNLLLVDKEEKSLATLMRHQITDMAVAQLQNMIKQGVQYRVPLPVMAQFYAGAVLAVVTWWLENDLPISSAELTHYLDLLLKNEQLAPINDRKANNPLK
ncbi:MAG: TetR/AcrR family transcriptional regulator [Anaerolineae bacterium]